jgi:hypothetical protein
LVSQVHLCLSLRGCADLRELQDLKVYLGRPVPEVPSVSRGRQEFKVRKDRQVIKVSKVRKVKWVQSVRQDRRVKQAPADRREFKDPRVQAGQKVIRE